MGNVPELRFSEFSNLWTKTTLGDFTKINQGLQIPIANRYLKKVEGSHFYITNEFLRKNSNKSYFILNPAESVICNQNDILMTRTGNTGQVVTGVSGAFHNNFFKIKFDTSKYNKNFIVYFLRLRQTQNLISRLAGTSTIPDLNHRDFYKIPFQATDLKEQKKIADFFSSVDNKISLLTGKQNLLQRYKKGVMQKLFSQELRFKDDQGNDFPEWDYKTIQSLIDDKVITGHLDGNHGELYPKSEEFSSDGIPYISANDLDGRNVDLTKSKKLPKYRADKFKKGIARTGDVLFAHNATVGPTALLKTNFDYVILSTTVTYFRCNLGQLNNSFLLASFNSDYFVKQYSRVMSQSTRNQVPITTQRKFYLNIPTLREQEKIANFLNEIDKKIEAVTKQIEQFQSFKKGLLQKMFV